MVFEGARSCWTQRPKAQDTKQQRQCAPELRKCRSRLLKEVPRLYGIVGSVWPVFLMQEHGREQEQRWGHMYGATRVGAMCGSFDAAGRRFVQRDDSCSALFDEFGVQGCGSKVGRTLRQYLAQAYAQARFECC